jgi:uncharacterized protein YndB with AHSA1/START domain
MNGWSSPSNGTSPTRTVRPVDTLVTVQLSDAPDGGTLMDFTHEGLKSEQSLTGHKHGWTSTFERLETFLAESRENLTTPGV